MRYKLYIDFSAWEEIDIECEPEEFDARVERVVDSFAGEHGNYRIDGWETEVSTD